MGVFLAVAALVGAYHLGRARADGVPTVTPLFYGGMLEDNGRPVEGRRDLTIRLWDAATGGATACTTAVVNVEFAAGRFRVPLDASCAGAVRSNPNLWAEVQIGGTTFPRSKLGAVPYALEAGRASGAAGALETRLAALEAGGMGGGTVVHTSAWRPPDGGAIDYHYYVPTDVLPEVGLEFDIRPHPMQVEFVAEFETYILPRMGNSGIAGTISCDGADGGAVVASSNFTSSVYLDPPPVRWVPVIFAGNLASVAQLRRGVAYRMSARYTATQNGLDRCRLMPRLVLAVSYGWSIIGIR